MLHIEIRSILFNNCNTVKALYLNFIHQYGFKFHRMICLIRRSKFIWSQSKVKDTGIKRLK